MLQGAAEQFLVILRRQALPGTADIDVAGRQDGARLQRPRRHQALAEILPVDHLALRQFALSADRKSVVSGKSVSVRVDLGCRRDIQKKTKRAYKHDINNS